MGGGASPLLRFLLFWPPLGLLGLYMYADLLRRFATLPESIGWRSLDIKTYQKAGEAIVAGDLPYRDFFIEYPPGSLPLFVPPALLSESRQAYATFFTSEMALVLVAALILTALTARSLGRLWVAPAVTFAAGAIMLYPVAVSRYDAAVALTLAATVALAVRGSRWANVVAWASLGLGAAAKLIPVLVAPALAMVSGWRAALRGAAAFALVVAAFFAPALLLGGEGFARSFSYHVDRGLQVESVAASALMRLGYVDDVAFEFGAIEVVGRGVAYWSSMSMFVTLALLVVTAAVALREKSLGRLGAETFPRYAAALLLAFMIGAKVLSPQYAIWLLPLVPLCAPGLWGLGASGLFLAACWVTTQVFPTNYDALTGLQMPAINLLVERNLLLIILWVLLLILPTAKASKPRPDEVL